MNDELRAALDKLDAALAEARAALEKPAAVTIQRGGAVTLDGKKIGCIAPEPMPQSITEKWGLAEPAPEPEPSSVVVLGSTFQQIDMSPVAIRAACAEKGVPCPAEEAD